MALELMQIRKIKIFHAVLLCPFFLIIENDKLKKMQKSTMRF